MSNRLKQLSRRDIERLSAYLDGELSEAEAAKLEARLQAEPLLRGGLEEMRQTSQLVAALPQARVPRNFILSPEMAGQVERGWRYPVMQLATALAAFAFLVVVGFDAIASQGFSFGAGAPNMAAEAPVAEEAAPPEALMEMQGDAESDQPAAEPRAEVQEATETSQTEAFGAAEAPAEEEALESEPTETHAPEGDGAALDEAEAERTAMATATPIPSPEPTETTVVSEPEPPSPQAARDWLRWLEIGLALLVIVFAGLTFRLRPGS